MKNPASIDINPDYASSFTFEGLVATFFTFSGLCALLRDAKFKSGMSFCFVVYSISR